MSSFGYSTPEQLEDGVSSPCGSSLFAPPELPPLALGPNCTRSAITSVRYFFSPLVLSSQLLVCSLPSINTELPFFMYCATVSACRPKTTTLWKSVCSCFFPSLSRKTRFVAIEKFTTFIPDGRAFHSGSRVRFPNKRTLFIYIWISLYPVAYSL